MPNILANVGKIRYNRLLFMYIILDVTDGSGARRADPESNLAVVVYMYNTGSQELTRVQTDPHLLRVCLVYLLLLHCLLQTHTLIVSVATRQ